MIDDDLTDEERITLVERGELTSSTASAQKPGNVPDEDEPSECPECGYRGDDVEPYDHMDVCATCRHADLMRHESDACPSCEPEKANHEFIECPKADQDENDEDDDGKGSGFENGENEVLFEFDGLSRGQLRAFGTALRSLLDKYDAYCIVVNSSDWD